MIEIISGTDRPNSNTIKVARYVMDLFTDLKAEVNLLDLSKLDLREVAAGDYYKGATGNYLAAVERVTNADGVMVIVPEYNGSFPGSLKLFVDYWRYPETFEGRPFAFVGLGTRWGGLRPVEHMQQVLGYRNAYLFPNRVFLSNVKHVFQDGKVTDQLMADLLKIQARDFLKFVQALKYQNLDANSRRQQPKP